MAYQNNIKAIPLKSIASTALTTYVPFDAAGIPNTCFVLKIVNNSDEDVTVSFDGTTDHDFVPKATITELPPIYASLPNNNTALWPQGQKVYIKGTAGSTGSVYLAGYFLPKSTV